MLNKIVFKYVPITLFKILVCNLNVYNQGYYLTVYLKPMQLYLLKAPLDCNPLFLNCNYQTGLEKTLIYKCSFLSYRIHIKHSPQCSCFILFSSSLFLLLQFNVTLIATMIALTSAN